MAARASTAWRSCRPTGSPAIAREALAFIATKPKGRHKVRVRRLAAGANGGRPDGALIEIVNDDMPFLVDSVLGELQARGIGVRLLLHPIFKTRRDKAGRLQDVARVGDDKSSEGHQESYIAVHIKALPDAGGARSRRYAVGHPR